MQFQLLYGQFTDFPEFGQGFLDIEALLLQLFCCTLHFTQKKTCLRDLIGIGVVKVKVFRHLFQGEAEPLRSQNERKPGPVTL